MLYQPPPFSRRCGHRRPTFRTANDPKTGLGSIVALGRRLGSVCWTRRGADTPFPTSAGARRRRHATTAARAAEGTRGGAAKVATKMEGPGTFPNPRTRNGLRNSTSIRSPKLQPRRWKTLRWCKFGGRLWAEEGMALLAEARGSLLDVRAAHRCSRFARAKARERMRSV